MNSEERSGRLRTSALSGPNIAHLAACRDLLLEWYQVSGREFPWRVERDPFRLLLSEILLQKTTAEAVSARYYQFFDRFPCADLVVAAWDSEILELLHPLGLPKRITTIRHVAGLIVNDWAGMIPDSEGELLTVPGLGPYSVRAFLSNAYQLPLLAVDSNVARVISRCFDIRYDPKQRRIPKSIREFANSFPVIDFVPQINYAFLDLGAKICRSRRPLCQQCPLVLTCVYARAADLASVKEG